MFMHIYLRKMENITLGRYLTGVPQPEIRYFYWNTIMVHNNGFIIPSGDK